MSLGISFAATWEAAHLYRLWQWPFMWNLGHMMVSLNFVRKLVDLPWNFPQDSLSFILNSGTWSLFLIKPKAFFFCHLCPCLHCWICAFLCRNVSFLCLVFEFPSDWLLNCLHPSLWFRSQVWSFLGGKQCWICSWMWISSNLMSRLLTSSLSNNFLQSLRNKVKQVSITFNTFPGKHLAWVIANL